MNKPRRAPRRRIDGVLLLDKPPGMSSNAALQKARWLFNAEKGGHTGTLDPMATGLLPLCLGEATKFASELLDADKTYEATVRLGQTTDTADAEGQVLESRPVDVNDAQLATAIARFVGDIEQVPPMYSALKRDGKPLYEYARAGIELERQARSVTIHSIEQLGRDEGDIRLRVHCSKGTYIRTLAADLGEALGCGAHLAALRRTRIGDLDIADALPLATLESMEGPVRDACLQPADALLSRLPIVHLDAAIAARFLHGQTVSQAGAPGRCRVYGGNRFIGLGEITPEGWLKPLRLLATAA
ncbi:MAG: tRNA pseudouridine(55) synthase TruB [Rhodocyclaceae bacterium]|nr:tRNA pseudouridine(55) synthase TruB [Rhodocyclaceae bacterium]